MGGVSTALSITTDVSKISPHILWSGLKSALVTTFSGSFVYCFLLSYGISVQLSANRKHRIKYFDYLKMNENYNKIMAYFALSNIFGYFLLENYYIPCLIGIWLYYSYNNEQKVNRLFMKNNLMISYIFLLELCFVKSLGQCITIICKYFTMRIFYRYIGLKNKGE